MFGPAASRAEPTEGTTPWGPAWSRADGIALALVTLAGGAVRFVRLSTPGKLYFDELYYAQDACLFVKTPAACGVAGAVSKEHPLLGKWLIAGGIKLFGYDAFGWRFVPALAGALGVALLYVLARRLLRSALAATLASGLLAVDFLHFVQSRMAMLDVLVTSFGLAAFLFIVVDRDRSLARPPGEGGPRRAVRGRPWRLAAGAAAGAALATKWSGAFVLLAVAGLTAAWEVRRRRDGGVEGPLRLTLREEGPSIAVALVLVPALIYVASFAGRLDGAVFALPWARGSWVRAFLRRQWYMLRFHIDLDGVYPYTSPAWTWLLLKRPVVYFFDTPGGRFREVLALGSPLSWWASIPALLFTAERWLRRRDPRGPEGVIIAGFAASYLPWLVLTQARTFDFVFYLLPAVPFTCLSLAYVAVRVVRFAWARIGVAAFAAASIGLFAFYYPVLAAVPIAPPAWESRILFDDCRDTIYSKGEPRRPVLKPEPPPAGWCWI